MTEESRIKKEITDLLDIRGAYWIRVAGGSYSKIGDPDLVVCYKGRFIALEVKTPTGVQSEWQKTREIQIKTARGVYAIVESADDVEKVLADSIKEVNPWLQRLKQ